MVDPAGPAARRWPGRGSSCQGCSSPARIAAAPAAPRSGPSAAAAWIGQYGSRSRARASRIRSALPLVQDQPCACSGFGDQADGGLWHRHTSAGLHRRRARHLVARAEPGLLLVVQGPPEGWMSTHVHPPAPSAAEGAVPRLLPSSSCPRPNRCAEMRNAERHLVRGWAARTARTASSDVRARP